MNASNEIVSGMGEAVSQIQGAATTPDEKLFELAPDKLEICLRLNNASGRFELTHFLSSPILEDWRTYERNLKSTVEAPEQSPDALQFESASMEAAVALYDSLFLGANGYCLPRENGGVTCGQIPAHHKEMVVRSLGDVAPEQPHQDEDDGGPDVALFSLEPDHIRVTLRAHALGKGYQGLVHIFTPPSAADRIQYSRIISQALYIRGSRTLKTLLPVRLPGLVKLYDQLISEVRGYCVYEQPIADRAAIIKFMDPLHKKTAVQELFEA
jgi:hypothetical protein